MQGDAPRLTDTAAWLRRAVLDVRAAEVDDALNLARESYEAVLSRLPVEVRPTA